MMAGPPRPLWRRDPRAALVALVVGAAILFGLVALSALFVPSLEHADATISSAIRSVGDRSPIVLSLAIGFTFLGSAVFVTAVTTAVSIWMLARRRLDALVYLLCTVPLGWYISDLLRQLIGRQRPVGVARIALPTGFSLPSGHTVAASLLCGAVAVIVVLDRSSPIAKKWALGLGLAIPVLVGLSRVYLGVHWFGDVLAAWLFAAAWWGLTTSVYLGVIARRQEVPR